MNKDELKQLQKEKRREFYLKMKERTAPARKAAYERQKAAFKVRQAEKKAKLKAEKAAAREAEVAERSAPVRLTLVPGERAKAVLRLVEPLD